MSHEFDGSDFSSDGVSKRAVGTILTGLGIGTMFWSVLFLAFAG